MFSINYRHSTPNEIKSKKLVTPLQKNASSVTSNSISLNLPGKLIIALLKKMTLEDINKN